MVAPTNCDTKQAEHSAAVSSAPGEHRVKRAENYAVYHHLTNDSTQPDFVENNIADIEAGKQQVDTTEDKHNWQLKQIRKQAGGVETDPKVTAFKKTKEELENRLDLALDTLELEVDPNESTAAKLRKFSEGYNKKYIAGTGKKPLRISTGKNMPLNAEKVRAINKTLEIRRKNAALNKLDCTTIGEAKSSASLPKPGISVKKPQNPALAKPALTTPAAQPPINTKPSEPTTTRSNLQPSATTTPIPQRPVSAPKPQPQHQQSAIETAHEREQQITGKYKELKGVTKELTEIDSKSGFSAAIIEGRLPAPEFDNEIAQMRTLTSDANRVVGELGGLVADIRTLGDQIKSSGNSQDLEKFGAVAKNYNRLLANNQDFLNTTSNFNKFFSDYDKLRNNQRIGDSISHWDNGKFVATKRHKTSPPPQPAVAPALTTPKPTTKNTNTTPPVFSVKQAIVGTNREITDPNEIKTLSKKQATTIDLPQGLVSSVKPKMFRPMINSPELKKFAGKRVKELRKKFPNNEQYLSAMKNELENLDLSKFSSVDRMIQLGKNYDPYFNIEYDLQTDGSSIGLILNDKEVFDILPGSPAAIAGIKEGDIPLAYGIKSSKDDGFNVFERGEMDAETFGRTIVENYKSGEPIYLQLERDGKTKDFFVSPNKIDRTLVNRDEDKIAIKFPNFNQETANRITEVFGTSGNVSTFDEISFDLRGNSGGDANATAAILSTIIGKGKKVSRLAAYDPSSKIATVLKHNNNWKVTDGTKRADAKMYDLFFDDKTASAAEIFIQAAAAHIPPEKLRIIHVNENGETRQLTPREYFNRPKVKPITTLVVNKGESGGRHWNYTMSLGTWETPPPFSTRGNNSST